MLERAAGAVKADAMICTEKDVFNLRDAGTGRLPVYACRIGLTIADGAKFWESVLSSVASGRRTVKP